MNRLSTRHHSVNRIQGKFTPVPEALHRDVQDIKLQAVWTILFMHRDRETGICTMGNRKLASIIGKCKRTVIRYTDELHESSWLCKHVKRLPGKKRNEENTYTFPHLENLSGDKNVIEKNPDLNTNTTAPRKVPREEERQTDHGKEITAKISTLDARERCERDNDEGTSGISNEDNGSSRLHRRSNRTVGNRGDTVGNQSRDDASGVHVSYHRLKWEHNRFHNHPPAMRELYERNGALMAENRRLRDSKVYAGASMGTWNPNNPNDLYEIARLQNEQANEAARQWSWVHEGPDTESSGGR